MSKADEFIRELHADLAPVAGEEASERRDTLGVRLSPLEIEQVEAIAASANLKVSVFIRSAVLRRLRDARKAGALEQVKEPVRA
jgi:hypothetical protein